MMKSKYDEKNPHFEFDSDLIHNLCGRQVQFG